MTEADAMRDAHHELQAYTLVHSDAAFIHQHVVDAWIAQQADERTKPIALTFALAGLYLRVERQFTGRQVQQVHMQLARVRKSWPTFVAPRDRGVVTPIDVMKAQAGPARDQAIDAWCTSVWTSWAGLAGNRQAVIDLLSRHL